MTANLEKLGNSRVKLTMNIGADNLEKAIEEAYRRNAKKISLRGFRKGRAPRQLIEMNYGPNVFLEDALDILLPRAYEDALKETEIVPVEQPQVGIEQAERGVGVIFTFEVDVYPELTPGEYKGLAAEKKLITVAEEDVETVLEDQRERSAQLVVAENKTVQAGDFAVLDFMGSIDGQPFSGGAAENQMLEVGSGQFIPGFEEQIVGMEINETREIQVTFPEDYHVEALAGKEAVFRATIKELKQKALPALDDEFAKDISDHDTLDELKKEIRKNLEDEAARKTKSELENSLLKMIAEDSEGEIPRSMIVNRAEQMADYYLQNVGMQGLSKEKYLEITGQGIEELNAQFEEQALEQINRDLILESIAEREGITVSEEEVNNKIDEYLGTSEMEPEMEKRLREYWSGQKENIETSLRREKALQLIVDNAEITERREEN